MTCVRADRKTQLQLEQERATVVDLKLQVHKNKGLNDQVGWVSTL